jgi:hypothetical protein
MAAKDTDQITRFRHRPEISEVRVPSSELKYVVAMPLSEFLEIFIKL